MRKQTRLLVCAALCVAMGIALPMTFHFIPNAGSVLLPMHIPMLLCGLICGVKYGFIVGALTPALSSLLTGMPPAAILPGMICELAVYGLVSGLCAEHLRLRSRPVEIYASLLTAMIAGRIVSGALNAALFRAGSYSLQMWLAASFTTALPGIVLQLVVIPVLVAVLEKARFLPRTAQEGAR